MLIVKCQILKVKHLTIFKPKTYKTFYSRKCIWNIVCEMAAISSRGEDLNISYTGDGNTNAADMMCVCFYPRSLFHASIATIGPNTRQ